MKKILATIFGLSVLSACAVMLDDKEQTLIFDSNQENAEIYIDRKFVCTTPCSTKVVKNAEKILIQAKKEGFPTRVIESDPKYSSTFIMNFSLTVLSPFGFTTDAFAGKSREYRPGEFFITMYHEPKTKQEKDAIKEQEEIYDFITENFNSIMIKREYATVQTISQLAKISEDDVLDIRDSSSKYCEMEFLSKIMKKYKSPNISNSINLPYACEPKVITKTFGIIPHSKGTVDIPMNIKIK